MGVDHFYAKIAGVSHDNQDGSSRQSIIRLCEVGEQLRLDHDEGNEHDRFAVKLIRSTGEQVGYLPSDLARQVVQRSSTGTRYAAFIQDLTGGTPDKPTRGANLLLIAASPGTSDEAAQAYVDSALSPDTGSRLIGDRDSKTKDAGKAGCLLSIVAIVSSLGTIAILASSP
ncbi:MAG: HIRAN domain-containing protein [Planctomycetota bacterium]